MEQQLEEQSLDVLSTNKRELENLVSSPGWALLVEAVDASIALDSGSNAQECQELVDVLKKEFRNGVTRGKADALRMPEDLILACTAEIDARIDQEEGEEEDE